MKYLFLIIIFSLLKYAQAQAQTSYINYVLGKYIGVVYNSGCPSPITSNGALYLVPDANYNFTVYEEDSSAACMCTEPWHIIVNADSTLKRYVGGQDNVVDGKLYPNDSIYLKVIIFGNPVCHRTFNGFKLYSTVGIKDLNKPENELLISPQPASYIVYVQSTQILFKEEDIPTLYDISGKQINLPIQYINANTYKLDVSGLNAGMYVVTIKTGKGVLRKKIVIEK